MPFIDHLGTSSTYSGHGASAGGEVQQRSWLKALEDAGLRDALSETRRFRSGSGHPAPASDSAPEQAGRLAATPGLAETIDTVAVRFHSGRSTSPGGAPAGEVPTPFGGSAKLPAGASPMGAVVTPAHGEAGSFGNEIVGSAESRLPLEMVLRQKWQARKVTVLPYEEGVEVWVRDSTVSGEGLKGLLTGVQRSASELGATVVRVFVNGKDVKSSGAPGAGKLTNKEG
ncbi:MAG: hypothetical protein HYU78_13960 [Rhodocyclales bacterium]|nr:hypothetical protein [Rhodocyclales bacterium]